MSNMKFCGSCGTEYRELVWPRSCSECGEVVWKSPKPISFAIQPVFDPDLGRTGLAIAQRAFSPPGGWALIGGYVDLEDTDVVSAAIREFKEETNLTTPGSGKIVFSEANSRGFMLLGVLMDTPILYDDYVKHGRVCHENLQLDVLWNMGDIELCFPIHTRAARMWFDGEFNY